MERKIGEIFKYNCEWYQTVEAPIDEHSCNGCQGCCMGGSHIFEGECNGNARKDGKFVIFKKLKKVGEPFSCNYYGDDRLVMMQEYQLFDSNVIYCYQTPPMYITDYKHKRIAIELKQIKEDMEEKKLIELLSEKVHNAWMKEKEAQGFSYGKDYNEEKKKHPDMLPYNELKEEVKEYDRATVRAVLQAQKELQSKYNYNNLKSFDLEAAKAGKPVCTRDGRSARIVCFDRRIDRPIVALIERDNHEEVLQCCFDNGRCCCDITSDHDLMMLPEKKEGWVNVYRDCDGVNITENDNIYSSEEAAIASAQIINKDGYVATTKITWEE